VGEIGAGSDEVGGDDGFAVSRGKRVQSAQSEGYGHSGKQEGKGKFAALK
jgi:hypothetical protein